MFGPRTLWRSLICGWWWMLTERQNILGRSTCINMVDLPNDRSNAHSY